MGGGGFLCQAERQGLTVHKTTIEGKTNKEKFNKIIQQIQGKQTQKDKQQLKDDV